MIKKLKDSLTKKFSLTSSKDLEKAVLLANYLFSLGDVKESCELLDSFIYKVEHSSGKEDVWASNGQGLILRSYMARQVSDLETSKKLVNILKNEDFMTDRCGRYELYLEDYEDHQGNVEDAMSETKKYKCEILSQESLKFLYYLEMLPFYENEVPQGFEQNLKLLIDSCYIELKKALSN